MSARDEVVDALVAERYGPSLWWKAPDKEGDEDDELTTARRRKQADEDERKKGSA